MGHDGENVRFVPFGGQAPDPDAFLSTVLDGWGAQQRAKDFAPATIGTRRRVVMSLVDFSGRYPWEWTLSDADDFFSHARTVRNLSHGIVRSYQGAIKLFCDYACDPHYDWCEQVAGSFGQVFAQVVTELNRITHAQPTEARPAKRPFTQAELQELFDLADLEVERILISGRKGAVAAWRDAIEFKTAYSWGLRSNGLRHLQVVDFSSNNRAPYLGGHGVLRVRWGKPHRGSAKKVRSVLTVWPWSADMIQDWTRNGLPHYGHPVRLVPRRAPRQLCPAPGTASSSTPTSMPGRTVSSPKFGPSSNLCCIGAGFLSIESRSLRRHEDRPFRPFAASLDAALHPPSSTGTALFT